MMKRMTAVLCLVLGLMGTRADAAALPGEVGTDFAASLAMAEAQAVPIAVVWGNTSCDHCKELAEILETSDELAAWLAEKQVLLVHKHEKYSSKDADYLAAKEWINAIAKKEGKELGGYPFVGLHWQNEEGVALVSTAFTGRVGVMPVKTPKGDLEGQFIGTLKQHFNAYEPEASGTFVTTADIHARLEADCDTVNVSVPMVRTQTRAYVQKIVLSAPNRATVTNDVAWAEDETAKTFDVVMADWYVADTEVTLELLDGRGEVASETAIGCVGSVPNSSTNPYWLGERTAATLAWGEWTMDLVAATQKVAAAEGEAYALILVGGSKWCPDCVKTDRWLLDQEAFVNWTRSRQVVCVNIDLPKVSSDATTGKTTLAASPSLLSYEPCRVSDRYVNSCVDGEDSRYQSGAGYLSRHGIVQTGNGGTNATAVAVRNEWLFMTGTDDGGLCRPDCLDEKNEQTGIFKTGVPCLIVMDKHGRIIGRNFQFNNESPDAFEPCYIDRMDELLAQAADPSEETNDSWLTTKDELPLRGNTGTGEDRKTLSYNDVNDWYRVAENAAGAKVEYSLTGDADAVVRLAVVQVAGKAERELQAVTASLQQGLQLSVEKMPSNSFVRVSAPLTASSWGVTYGYFALTNKTSTVADYVLTSDAVLQPTESLQQFEVASGGEMSVTVEIIEGRSYRFGGEGEISDKRLAYNYEAGVYVAAASGNVQVPLVTQTFTYQIWNPGLLVFERTAGTEKEPTSGVTEHVIRIKRTGGASGCAKARVEIDWERTTPLSDVFEFDDAQEHEWVEGDTDDWPLTVRILPNEHSDGDQPIVLVLRRTDGSDVEVGAANEYALTVTDNDPSSPGKVRIASVTPAQVSGTVYAREGESVAVTLDRTGGSDGAVGCRLKASAGILDKETFSWKSRDASAQTAVLSLANVAVGAACNVTLEPDAGTKAVSSARSFKVQVVAADAPAFETNAVTYAVYRHVAVDAQPIGVESRAGERVTVSKVAGRIPGGVKAEYDAARCALVFSGVPTANAGDYASVYRVTAGSQKGLVVAVIFRVIDPVKASTPTGTPLNAACAKTRTFADLLVYSDAEMTRLVGLATVTVPASGRLSAKYVCASGTVSLVAKSWSSVATDGALTAKLVGTTKKTSAYTMTVTAFADGSLTCFLQDPACHDAPVSVLRPGDDWRLLDDGAADWQGYYTASLAQRSTEGDDTQTQGDGYMTFKMDTAAAIRRGQMSYAGLLPNGKAFSGARSLWGYCQPELHEMVLAFLPVFNVSSSDDVSGLVLITPGARELHSAWRRSVYNDENTYELFNTNRFVWVSKPRASGGRTRETEFDVYGGYYDASENFQFLCEQTFETSGLTFFVQPQKIDAEASWSTNDTGVAVQTTAAGRNTLSLLVPDNEQDLTLSFNRASGLVSGRLLLSVFGGLCPVQYKGVVLPGWGSAKCTECGDPKEWEKRPFVSGAAYFKVGSETYSCPFSIGLEDGK